MDQQIVCDTVEAHAQAIVDPIDVGHVEADLIEELHPQLPSPR